ncbi:hypothetical protein Y032_0666g1331 [Ancylostoma ceylanicum]|uniref:Uncharacterized protein n=1 Tax=Ancylostoma ceylanicum TaxID=53326 RepID=A0A016WJQ1_9BILA|nr:hypothetical protein Y032_0666g1331 [Ancylostoma ceylanicum]
MSVHRTSAFLRGGLVLTSRYQLRENVATTKITLYLTGIQTILFLLYTACATMIRLHQELIFGDNVKAFTAAKLSFYLMPLFTLLLPVLTTTLIRRYRYRRTEQIRSIVSLESTGYAGTRNYDEVISKMWEKPRTSVSVAKTICKAK